MRFSLVFLLLATAMALCAQTVRQQSYLGFDRNLYPGDDALPILRKTFSFAGYWLGPPPGETASTWSGKRDLLQKNGFGFAVLFRGRQDKELKTIEDASTKGEGDAAAAIEAAQREGFSSQTIIYLDIEEGGRLSPNYHRYIISWLGRLSPANFRGGFYCSAIPVSEGKGKTITTCEDILSDLAPRFRDFSLWAYNDVCPPSPGCAFPKNPAAPSKGAKFCTDCVSIWQFAQSPRRKEFTRRCPAGYAKDNNCYAPGDAAHRWHLDVSSASTPDPSNAREH